MAYNRSKHLNAAQKYLQQGKLPQAIAEYQQIVKNEPKDQVTLMTLGDLFVRQGETVQALEYFERLAKIFLNDGFTTKAIAIYKKVAKLAPEESRPLERLAELYVQQGVLSEARPLYLQLAEMHLKAGHQQEAVGLLKKLLEAEPDNLRVQTRLAELLLTMGQQKAAVEAFHGALQKMHERGDHAEAVRLADRILKLDPKHTPSLQAKVRSLSAAGKTTEAAKLLESLPHEEQGGENTSILLNHHLESGQPAKAAALAEKLFASDAKNYEAAHRAANALLEAKDWDRAESLLTLIRDAMINAGETDALAQSVARLVEGQPGHIEALEWLVDLYGRTSDSFRLPDALGQLAYAYETSGDASRALATYEKLLERTPEDETVRRKYSQLRSRSGLEPVSGEIAPAVKVAPAEVEAAPEVPAAPEPSLDEETQRYVTQALTDVDLFSSYGLTQKAIDLLEAVLERAPRHSPVLERLLDLSVGSGNDRRTADIAALLQEIATERGDHAAAERYADFSRRFQRAAGINAQAEEIQPAAPPAAAPAVAPQPPAAPREFAVPTIEAKLEEEVAPAPTPAAPPEPAPVEQARAPKPAESAVHEVDLSDEWAALSVQLETAMKQEAASILAETDAPKHKRQDPAPAAPPAEPQQAPAEAAGVPEVPAFDLELQAVPAQDSQDEVMPGDAVVADITSQFDSAISSLGESAHPAPPVARKPAAPPAPKPVPPTAPVNTAPAARAVSGNGGSSTAPAGGGASLEGPLGDLFEEFRSELDESTQDEEDPETHYNLGIAYREMGLLEEAISEFQKVAKRAEKTPTFRYTMQCSTLLGLSFMDKGQPAIAAIWYERALKTPGLDQETVLALKYDLGVAQEMAGDAKAAFNSFSQVYAMNIDYRDVSERIALLGKAR